MGYVNQYVEQQLNGDSGYLSLNKMEISSFDEISGCFTARYELQRHRETANSVANRCIAIVEFQQLVNDTLADLASSGFEFGISGEGKGKRATLVLAPTSTFTSTIKGSSSASARVTSQSSVVIIQSANAEASSSMTTYVLIGVIAFLVLGSAMWACNPKPQPDVSESPQPFQPMPPDDPAVILSPIDSHIIKTPTRGSMRNPNKSGTLRKSVTFLANAEKSKTLVARLPQACVSRTVAGFNLDLENDLPFSIVTLGGVQVRGFDDADDYGESSF